MVQRHGTGSQLMGFVLAIIAWLSCLTSTLMMDWNRSVVKLPEKIETYTRLVPATQFNQSFSKCNFTCNETEFYRISGNLTFKDDLNQTFYKVFATRVKPAKLLTIGYKGIWFECTFLPMYPTSFVKEMKLNFDPQHQYTRNYLPRGRSRYINQTLLGFNSSNRVGRHASSYSRSEMKHTRLLITNKVHLRGFIDRSTESYMARHCNYIGIARASCLVLGVRTVFCLSLICGCLAICLAFVSIHSDVKIRSLLRFHPLKKVFRKKNLFSVLSAVFCLLSGTYVIICCCWFTLESNEHFHTSAYQTHHDQNNGMFLVGDAVLVSVTSGVVYVIAGSLLGINVQAKSKTRTLTKRILEKFKFNSSRNDIEMHSSIL